MQFTTPMLVVESISRARKFYEEVLGLQVVLDFGENITFEGGVALQEKKLWLQFINKEEKDIKVKGNNFELYFEEEDFDGFLTQLNRQEGIEYVHDVVEYPWGQRVVRFYDLDKHIIEVGEKMEVVIKRFLAQGLSVEEVARISQHPIEFVEACAALV